jgi:hypothetical protein
MSIDVNEMTPEQYKAYESRVRARARRQGLRVAKSRSRTPEVIGYGTYMLIDRDTRFVVSYGLSSGYGLSLEEIEEQLAKNTQTADAD